MAAYMRPAHAEKGQHELKRHLKVLSYRSKQRRFSIRRRLTVIDVIIGYYYVITWRWYTYYGFLRGLQDTSSTCIRPFFRVGGQEF
eukprot:6183038-Pleurochrysis_carterae.AAC.2